MAKQRKYKGTKVLIFVGEHFYHDSSTMMSPIYERLINGQFLRSDWGKLGIMLEEGYNVMILQATKDEQKYFDGLLKQQIETMKKGRVR